MGKVDVKASDIKRFDVTGSTSATHTLSWTAPSEQSLIITINGVKQQDSAYTISGSPTTITLASALVATDEMEVIGINDIGQTNTVAQDSIVTDMIRNDAVTSAKLDTNIAIDGTFDVGSYLSVDSSGRVTMPNQPAFIAHTYVSTTITNGDKTPLPYTSLNIGNNFNTSTYIFTAPVSGTYCFGGMLREDNSGTYIHFIPVVNGVTSRNYNELPALNSTETSTGFAAGTMSWMRYLSANDTIYFEAYSSLSGTYAINNQTHIFGYLIG
jgi:hypothetical protein